MARAGAAGSIEEGRSLLGEERVGGAEAGNGGGAVAAEWNLDGLVAQRCEEALREGDAGSELLRRVANVERDDGACAGRGGFDGGAGCLDGLRPATGRGGALCGSRWGDGPFAEVGELGDADDRFAASGDGVGELGCARRVAFRNESAAVLCAALLLLEEGPGCGGELLGELFECGRALGRVCDNTEV